MRSVLLAAVALLVSMNVLAKEPEEKPTLVEVLNTPLEVKPVERELVNLERFTTSSVCTDSTNVGMRRRFPDGTVANEDFVVPEGYTLVITDFRWLAGPISTDPFLAGGVVSGELFPHPFGGWQLYRSTPRELSSPSTPAEGVDSLTTGIELGQGFSLCATAVRTVVGAGSFADARTMIIYDAQVLGYLVPNN